MAGKLFIVAAGEAKTVQECQPLFEALGQRTFVIAAEPPKANLVKLSGNFLIAAVIETLGEAFALVSKAGIDRAGYLEILTNTLLRCSLRLYTKPTEGSSQSSVTRLPASRRCWASRTSTWPLGRRKPYAYPCPLRVSSATAF